MPDTRLMPSEKSDSMASIDPSADRALAWDRFANAMCALLILGSLAFAAFRLGYIAQTSRAMTVDRAIFSAINAVSLTGFEQNYASIRAASESGLIILMMLTIASASVIGGTSSSLVLQLLGVRSTMWMLWLAHAGVYCVLAIVSGSVRAAFDNVGTLTLSGFLTREPVRSDSFEALFWFFPLVVIGSIGLIGIASLLRIIRVPQVGTPTCEETTELDRLGSRRDYSTIPAFAQVRVRTCGTPLNWLGLVALIYLICLAINSLVMPTFASSNAWAINARSAGLPMDSFRDLSASAQWLVMIQSLIGAMPGSTSGGLSVLPIALALAGLSRGVRGRSISRAESISILWIGSMILSICIVTLFLLQVHVPMSIDQAIFLSISALSNSGLSPDPLGLTGAPLIVLGCAEFFARFLSLGMLAWMVGEKPA